MNHGKSQIKGEFPTMVEYSERLKTAMAHANMKTRALSDAIGMTYQGVKKVLDGKSNAFSAENNSRAAAVLGVSPDWLATGAGAMAATETPRLSAMATTSNVEPGPDINGFYPLLTDVQAGAWTELCASFSREDAQGWHPSTKSLGPCGYMLRVKGRSMENPGGSPSFTEGMILHINPDLDPTPGLYVIVRRSGSDEATFKKYIHIDGIPYLEAINPDWPKDQKYLKLMPGDAWCGVVVDASLGGLI